MSRLTWRDLISGTIGLGTLVAIFLVVLSLSGSVKAYQSQDAIQNSLIASQEHTINKLRSQIIKLGETPVADAPSQKEIDRAVQGPQGPQGEPGENASTAQIAGAVADYCSAHGGCIGLSGQDGTAGEPGAPGVAGTPGTNGNDGAVGPQGPSGPAGAPGATGATGQSGPSGASVTSVVCQYDAAENTTELVFSVTASDGTVSTLTPVVAACVPTQ